MSEDLSISQIWSNIKPISDEIKTYSHLLRHSQSDQFIQAKDRYYSTVLSFICRNNIVEENLQLVDNLIHKITNIPDEHAVEILSTFSGFETHMQIRFLELAKKVNSKDDGISMMVERIVKNLSPDAELTNDVSDYIWRKQLSLLTTPDHFKKEASFFKKATKDYVVNNRHTSEEAQHAYDEQFGLVFVK